MCSNLNWLCRVLLCCPRWGTRSIWYTFEISLWSCEKRTSNSLSSPLREVHFTDSPSQAWRTCSHGLWSYHAFHLHLWLPLFPSYVRPRLKRPFSFSKLLGRLYASGVAERLRKVLAGATVVLSLSLILRLRVHHLRVTLLFASVLCCSDVFRSVVLSCCTLRFAVIYFIYCPLSPMSWKKPLWSPLLKLPSLDPEQFPNYRPISNLMFISKLCERVVAVQLTKYLCDNFLMAQFQSAYKPSHSPESALLKVQDDILQAIDND